jgi:hypothetical protein
VQLSVGPKMCRYLWEHLKERHLQIQLNEDSALYTRWWGKGIPHGYPLSPLLFNIVTVEICHRICDVYICQYADDFVLFSSFKLLSDNINGVQSSLNSIVLILSQ